MHGEDVPEHGQRREAPVLLTRGRVPVVVRGAVTLRQENLGEDAVGIHVPEIADGLGTPRGLDGGQLGGDLGEGVVPRDALVPVRPAPAQGMLQPILVLGERVARFALHAP